MENIFLPIVSVLGIAIVLWMGMGLRLWISKDNAPVRIRNLTDKVLKSTYWERFIEEISPMAEIENKKVLAEYEKYLIEAKDAEDKTVYSAELDLERT